MTDYYLLLAVAIGGLMNATPERRAAVYDRARAAMIDRLRSMDPPLAESEIENESQTFDAAVARLENELSPTPVPVERPAQRGSRFNRAPRNEKAAQRARPKAPAAPQEAFVPADVLTALRPLGSPTAAPPAEASIIAQEPFQASPPTQTAVAAAAEAPVLGFQKPFRVQAIQPATTTAAPIESATLVEPVSPLQVDEQKTAAAAPAVEKMAAAVSEPAPAIEPAAPVATAPAPIEVVAPIVEKMPAARKLASVSASPIAKVSEPIEPPAPIASPPAPAEAAIVEKVPATLKLASVKAEPIAKVSAAAPKPESRVELFKLKTVPKPPPPPAPAEMAKPESEAKTPAKAVPALTETQEDTLPLAARKSEIPPAPKAAPKRQLRDEPIETVPERRSRPGAASGRKSAAKADTSWAQPAWKTAPERRSSLSTSRKSPPPRALPPLRGSLARQVAAGAADRRFLVLKADRALIAAGVVMAFVSGAFGIYMNLPENESLRQANEQAMALTFPIDADATAANDASPPAEASPPQQTAAIDPVVTASIAPAPRRTVRRIEIDNVPSEPPAPSADNAPSLKDYHVRDVYQDMALIEGPHGLTLVKRGAKLQGVGLVTAIEKRDSKWVIATSEGIIADERP